MFMFQQVERRHLEAAVDESIKTLDIAGASDCGPPATSDDLQAGVTVGIGTDYAIFPRSHTRSTRLE